MTEDLDGYVCEYAGDPDRPDRPNESDEWLLPYERLLKMWSPRLKKMPYREFLETPYWRTLRRLIMKKRGPRCENCGRTRRQLDLHHITYAHRGDEHRNQDDLIILCEDCHAGWHSLDPPQGSRRDVRAITQADIDRQAKKRNGEEETKP